MGDLLGVSVEELVGILKKKHARLPFEIGAFVALETCEALLQGPAKVSASDVRVAEDGSVALFAPPNSATGAEAARSVVGVLAHVLVAAGPGVPPVLLDLVEHGPSDGRWDLARLRDELEASLVPLNRQAARRVLSRMLREARREGAARRQVAPEASADDVDAELDALIGGGGEPAARRPAPAEPEMDEPFAPPAVSTPAPAPEGSRALGDAIWDDPAPGFEDEAPTNERPVLPARDPDLSDSMMKTLVREAPPGLDAWEVSTRRERPATPVPTPRREPPPEPEPDPEPARSELPEREQSTPVVARGDVDLSGFDDAPPKRGRGLLVGLLFVVLVGGLVGGVAYFRPDAVDRALGRQTPEEREAERLAAERRAEQERLHGEHAQRFGDLVVRASPARAQILLFVGRGPAVATSLPVGVAHEFIAIADGREPTRAVVPPSAQWEATDDGPRYELAMQAGEDEMTFEALELGATRLPQDVGQPGTELGSVRVVTNPPGAKVYQLVGFAPNARVENLRTDEPVELLVWHEGHAPARVVVGPSDWREGEDGRRAAEIDVQLEERR